VQLKLADMASGITAARLLAYRAAEAGGGRAPDPDGAAMARIYAATVAYETALESMRIHGGYGYVSEFPIERYYRDAARLLVAPTDAGAERAALARRLAAHR
jgi:alkylation response protein AidB-like acyl-CoA dehydrogenase